MRKLMTSLAVLALAACGRPAETANDAGPTADANSLAPSNQAADPDFKITETSWEYTRDGKPTTETIDSAGNYVSWSGDEHIDHGTVAMKDGKACFTSAMTKDGEVCWAVRQTAVGETIEITSDKGEKLAIKRIDYMMSPPTP